MGAKRGGSATAPRPGQAGQYRLAMLDVNTGQIMDDGVPVWARRRVNLGEDFMLVMQRALMELADDRDAGYEATRVILHILGTADYENWVKINQTEIGARLNIKRPNVGRALKTLVERGYLEKAEARINGSHIYRINKAVAWKGRGTNWHKARRGDKAPALRLVHRQELPPKEG